MKPSESTCMRISQQGRSDVLALLLLHQSYSCERRTVPSDFALTTEFWTVSQYQQVPRATHQWAIWQDKERKVVHKVGPEEWIQPDKDCSRRRMEDSLPYQARTLWVYSNAIRPDQCPCVILRNDGYNLQRHGSLHLIPRRYSHLWWRYWR